ncbi:helix-turn-helix domain-containing protein [Ligilactobacillus saerimneri]|uniref:helix-turn-helix domain-containing protein n=1 Tax=Ligilactobacillus saerimneri TaxID=228229 RepID=UPI000489C92E|nr:helix-turn-helix transcriptional regulator [Ligilactobacillus saerimneri]
MPKISVRAARVNAGMTLREAAKLLGISYQTLSDYENNEDLIRLGTIKKMSEVYGIPVDYIFLK